MDDYVELSSTERYELIKLRALAEVQGELTDWAKKRMWLLLATIALVGFFGISGFISLTVGQGIEKKMDTVNAQVLAAVKSSVEAEFSARQATKSAETESKKVNDAASKLRETLESISREASKTEDQLKALSKAVDSQSENVRGESRLVTEGLERRIQNIERITQRLAQSTSTVTAKDVQSSVAELEGKANLEKDRYLDNSKYDVQITYDEKDAPLATKLLLVLRTRGFRTSLYKNLPEIERVWGVPATYLEGRITVLCPPGKEAIGKQIAELLKSSSQITNVKIGLDRNSNSAFAIGLLIPEGKGSSVTIQQ